MIRKGIHGFTFTDQREERRNCSCTKTTCLSLPFIPFGIFFFFFNAREGERDAILFQLVSRFLLVSDGSDRDRTEILSTVPYPFLRSSLGQPLSRLTTGLLCSHCYPENFLVIENPFSVTLLYSRRLGFIFFSGLLVCSRGSPTQS